MTDNTHTVSPRQAWLLAIRPRTLPAALSPVLVGAALAFQDGAFALLPALAALAGALLLQIGVNLANDYFDHVKGVDSHDRQGPLRVTQSGLIPPESVRLGMILTFALAALVGLYLVYVGGWPILIVGIASILSALAYSGGPYPLASHGLGDLFVFIFFGLVAVGGTYYVQALELPLNILLAAAPMGMLITAILVVNNIRDIETDRSAGKRTLAVMLGKRWSRVEYVLLVTGAYVVPPLMLINSHIPIIALLPLASFPHAAQRIRALYQAQDGPAMNQLLAATVQLGLLFSLLFSVGLVAGAWL